MITDSDYEKLDGTHDILQVHDNMVMETKSLISKLIQEYTKSTPRRYYSGESEFNRTYKGVTDVEQKILQVYDSLKTSYTMNPFYTIDSFHTVYNNVGLYSFCLNTKLIDVYQQKSDILEHKIITLLSTIGFYSPSTERQRYRDTSKYNMASFETVLPLLWNPSYHDYIYYHRPLFAYNSYTSWLDIAKFWWLLCDNEKVSSFALDLYMKDNNMQMKGFSSKMKSLLKKKNGKPITFSLDNNLSSLFTTQHDTKFLDRLKVLGIKI